MNSHLPRRNAVILIVAAFAILLGMVQPAMATDVVPGYQNRAPNTPTLLYPANNARLAMNSLRPTLQLRWRNNGDPEGERVSFYVDTMYYDVYTRTWKPAVKRSLWGTSCPVTFKGSAGSSVYLAWRVFAMDASRRSRPWHSVTGWSVFQVTFPTSNPPQPRTPTPTTGFDFGNRWEVYGHHAGSGVWTRDPNRANTFQATWKGRDGKTYYTVVTLRFKDGQVHAVSKFSDGRAHFHFFTEPLDKNLAVAKTLRAMPRNRKYGGQQHTGYGNGYVASYIVTR